MFLQVCIIISCQVRDCACPTVSDGSRPLSTYELEVCFMG